MGELASAVSNTKHPGFSAVSLPNADFIRQVQTARFALQPVQRIDQRTVAGAACRVRRSIGFQRGNPPRRLLPGGDAVIQGDDLRFGEVAAADTEAFGQTDVRNLADLIAHGLADETVTEHRIEAAEDAIHRDRVAALFEIEVAADVVHQNEPPAHDGIQVCDRLAQVTWVWQWPLSTGMLMRNAPSIAASQIRSCIPFAS